MKNRFIVFVFLNLMLLSTTSFAQTGFVNYTVLNSALLRISAPTNVVIRTLSQWKTFYQKNTVGIINPAPLPIIDFNKQEVIVLSNGSQATGGYTLLVSSVNETVQNIVVNSLFVKPSANCVVTMMITYPASLIVIPKNAKPVQFSQQQIENACL
jgi:hypothetical protein